MSARDSLTVTSLTAQDAREIARRQWGRDGLRVVRFVSAVRVQSAVFRIETPLGREHAETLAKAESRELGFLNKTRGYTVEVEPGVWHVELRVRTAGAAS